MFTICKICGMQESMTHTGDIDYCNECHSVEQGFDWVEENEDGILVTEEGEVYENQDI